MDSSSAQVQGERSVPRGGGFPYDGLYREVPLERGTFFTLIKAYERVETCDFSNCKKTQKAAKK